MKLLKLIKKFNIIQYHIFPTIGYKLLEDKSDVATAY